jgi:UDP-GlcNAc3NAcA epimerase
MKIITIVGARPQFIKAQAVSRALTVRNSQHKTHPANEILVHTGQHYDYEMSQIFFEELNIPEPNYHLEVGSADHGEMTGKMLDRIEKVLLKEKPHWVMVYGDTNSTLAGSLAAAKLQIPVAHIEAGLRSYNRKMPEEINRVVTDHISTLLFCPTDMAVTNLGKEGVTEGVFNVGDVMYDAFLSLRDLAIQKSTILHDLDLNPKAYCLSTIHRPENTDDPTRLLNIFAAFNELASPARPFVVPLHPRTRKALEAHSTFETTNNHLRIIPPVGYLDLISLELQAKLILTDSGGIQKESFFAGVPCVTVRNETEWVETVEGGWNRLAGPEPENIVRAFHDALEFQTDGRPDFYGNGNASELILDYLLTYSPS